MFQRQALGFFLFSHCLCAKRLLGVRFMVFDCTVGKIHSVHFYRNWHDVDANSNDKC